MKHSMKKIALGFLAGALTVANAMTVLAGTWQHDDKGWWYQKDDGSCYHNGWEWVDGNNDGVREAYYFTEDGYVLTNTTTPDGYTVNTDGAWVENGAVKTLGSLQQNTNASAAMSSDKIWLKDNGIYVKSDPAFTSISRWIFDTTRVGNWFGEKDTYGSFNENKELDTAIEITSADNNNYTDENMQATISAQYDNTNAQKDAIKEYDINGSHWLAFSASFADGSYAIDAITLSSKKFYQIGYYALIDNGKNHFSIEELLSKVEVTDDISTKWLDMDGGYKNISYQNGSTVFDFTLKQP